MEYSFGWVCYAVHLKGSSDEDREEDGSRVRDEGGLMPGWVYVLLLILLVIALFDIRSY
jgi:hypothetical protein